MPRSRWILAFISILVLLTCTSGRPYQPRTPEGGIVFQTGFVVRDEFLKVYLSADNPALIFGLPISGVVRHPLRPEIQVQYFQRARMELDSSAPEGKRVSLATLGIWLYDTTRRGQDANIDTSSLACRFFTSTRHYVCFAFLQFYDAHNGAVFFGDPISEVEMDGERMVQYFEKTRLEWWPERASGMRVDLTDVGTLDYRLNFGDPQPPNPGNIDTPKTPENLLVRVFPAKPLLGQNETQTVFVIVQDQLFNPVNGAQVELAVQLPDGTSKPLRYQTTDSFGIVKVNIDPIGFFIPNQMVLVKVKVSMKDVQPVDTTTWYRIWW